MMVFGKEQIWFIFPPFVYVLVGLCLHDLSGNPMLEVGAVISPIL